MFSPATAAPTAAAEDFFAALRTVNPFTDNRVAGAADEAADVAAVHAAAPALAPLVPALVDAVYAKLYSYTATWRHFVPRQFGYEGDVPQDLAHLTPDHPQIKFRKEHLARYLAEIGRAHV